MAQLSVQKPSTTGATVAFGAAAGGGDTFPNDGQTYFHCKNGGGGSINVTITSIRNCNQGGNHNLVVAVGAGSEKVIGPFDPDRFNGGGSNLVSVAYSGVATVTVAAVSLAP